MNEVVGADRLIADGHNVCVLDNFSTGKVKNLFGVHGSENLKIIRTDVRRIPSSLVWTLRRVDGVCHLAAMTDVQEPIKHPIPTSDVNLLGTLRVLEESSRPNA